jgi:3D (Asp-Asp-Asp) domain-containing protein
LSVPLSRLRIAALVLTVSACAPRAPVHVAPSPPPKLTTAAGPLAPEETRFVATAYCQDGKTASGAHTASGIVAADPDVLPIGTRIRVRGLKRGSDGIYRVMDTGARVQGRRIDLFVASCAEAKRFGRQPVHVAIVR